MDVEIIDEERYNNLSAKNDFDRNAIEAFKLGKKYYPPTFQYGFGAGNPVSDLWTDGKILYYVQRINDGSYSYKNVPIAAKKLMIKVRYNDEV